MYAPALIFEYQEKSNAENTTVEEDAENNFSGWDYEDLLEFFSHFGEVAALEIYGKMAVVLFGTFFDANTAKEFLQNSNNFKETEQKHFNSRWFALQDESFISLQLKQKIAKIKNKFIEQRMAILGNQQAQFYNGFNNNAPQMNYNMHNYNNYSNNNKNSNFYDNNNNDYNGLYRQSSTNSNTNSDNSFNIRNSKGSDKRKGSVNSNNGGNINNYNNNHGHGKYTCKFEIQIENDKDFQIARRLIGAKVS